MIIEKLGIYSTNSHLSICRYLEMYQCKDFLSVTSLFTCWQGLKSICISNSVFLYTNISQQVKTLSSQCCATMTAQSQTQAVTNMFAKHILARIKAQATMHSGRKSLFIFLFLLFSYLFSHLTDNPSEHLILNYYKIAF